MKVIIATASYGAGHNAAARHLKSGILLVHPKAEVQIIDIAGQSFGKLDEQNRKFYLGMVNHTPKLWQAIFEWINRHPEKSISGPLFRPMEKEITRLLVEEYPDFWVSTYPVYNYFLDKMNAAVPRATVITDSISVNRIWTGCKHHPYISPNPATTACLTSLGVDEKWIHTLGFPVDPALDTLQPAPAWGTGPRILYVINGNLPVAETIVKFLSSANIQATIVTGSNERLLKKFAKYQSDRMKVLGWTKNVPELMQQHHLLITKAGGATVQEAIAAGIPMLVNQVIPGQEAGNWQLLEQAKASVLLEQPEDITSYLGKFTETTYRTLRANIEHIRTPQAATKIAQLIKS